MMQHGLRWLVLSMLLCLVCLGCAKKQIAPKAKAPTTQEIIDENQQAQRDWEAAEQERREQEARLIEEQIAEEQRAEEFRMQEEQARQEAILQLEGNKVYFAFDSFELKPQARTLLQAKAEILKEWPGLNLRIEGHCDDRGTEEYNLALGEKRARVAYEFLVLLGVEPQRLQIISYGEEYPADPAHNETAWALNRRDEFKVFR